MSDLKNIFIAIGKHESIAYAAGNIDDLFDDIVNGGTDLHELEFYEIEKATPMKLSLEAR